MEIFKIQSLTYYYPESEFPAIKDISLTIKEGELIFLAGLSGSGKSSFLKALAGLLPEFYGGRIGGNIEYKGNNLRDWDKRRLPTEIGIVFQDPEKQVCMTVVEHEVAFGLENLGIPRNEMHHRVAEVLSMLDLMELRERSIFELSSGQKQRVILASVLAMHPKVLILDEPTSQLDPIAANEFLDYLHRLNREWGTTIILSEQRVERCFDMADKVFVMHEGGIIYSGTPEELVRKPDKDLEIFYPPISRMFRAANMPFIPISVKEGREIIGKQLRVSGEYLSSFSQDNIDRYEDVVVDIKKLRFSYPKQPFALDIIDFEAYKGEVISILGENGAGKSTLLKLISRILEPRAGNISVLGNVGYLSQDPSDYLLSEKVYEQLLFALELKGIKESGQIDDILKRLQLYRYKDQNPRDLSSGEMQRVAIATVMVSDPKIILMDEPTRGMDNLVKEELIAIIDSLAKEDRCIIVVTHDIEFVAELSHRVIIMADGEIIIDGDMHEVIGSSFYYSTQVSRLFKNIDPHIIKVDEGARMLREYIVERKT
ncbi:MAG: ABC transporter ATP-binding protein [Clostridiales bacterium]|nr:ABC transporter ATP-binding protein [Clostridiales bacterium]